MSLIADSSNLNHDVLARCNRVLYFLLSFWYCLGVSEMCDFGCFFELILTLT